MNRFDPQSYWENRLGRHFGLKGVGRINFGESFNTWAYRIRGRVFLDVMRSAGLDWSDQAVLDCGVGTGFYVERWKELGVSSLTGIDLTSVAVQRLTERFPGNVFQQADVGGDWAGIKAQSFDAVSCMDVLFHVTDEACYHRALQNIHTVLKPGGLFVFTEVFPSNRRQLNPHVVIRSLSEIQDLLTATGFEVLLRRPFLVLMGDPLDTRNPLLKWQYQLVGLLSRADIVGFLAGAVLYPLEVLLVSHLSESPSTEIMLCRRRT